MFNRRSLLRIQGRGVLSGSNRVAISRWRNQAWNRLRSTDPHQGFNGAAISRSRNLDAWPRIARWPLRASMGPRSLDRGISSRPSFQTTSRARLQWGRDLSIAESRVDPGSATRPPRCFNGAAISRSRNQQADLRRVQAGPRFNGAAISRSRNPGRPSP